MKKKVLYLMHVDWNWIKQRPHFIAENLSLVFEMRVFYPYSRDRKAMTANPTNIKKFPIVTLPFKRIKIINVISILMQKITFYLILRVYNPEIIWITHPMLYDYLPKLDSKKHKIIYDCMDDVLGFDYIPRIKNELEIAEKNLLRESEIVFVSSENLRKKLVERGCNEKKTTLVRNGYNGEIIETKAESINNEKGAFKIAYIGTISQWLDFETIEFSLIHISNIEYHFYGPIDCQVPKNEKIIFHGPIKHQLLYETIIDFDCLIMPFKVNELILSVDPVKLYEYINFNKNIITIQYPEIERFKDFVYFYNNMEEYVKVIEKLIQDNRLKYNEHKRAEFLKENSWVKRTEIICNQINSI